MPQVIQLENGIVNGMEVEMRRQDVGIGIVRRMLHRGEILGFPVVGHDHHAAGVLAGGAFDATAAKRQPVDLGVIQHHAPILRVFADEAIGGLIRQCGDGAGLEHVVAAEQRLRVFMRL